MAILAQGEVLATVCREGVRQIDVIVSLHRDMADVRELLSAAMQLTHDQYKQLAEKDRTIARLRDELRQARASERRAA